MEYIGPHSIEAEQAVLGCMLLSQSSCDLAFEKLSKEDFYDKKHQLIFEAMATLYDNDVTVELITLANQLEKNGELKGVGGDVYIANLGNSMVTVSHIDEYIKIIQEKSVQRRLSKLGSDIAANAANETFDSEEILNKAEQEIMKVGQHKYAGKLEHIKNVLGTSFNDMIEASTRKGGLVGLSTGFKELDRLTLGFQKTQFIVIGARPGDGKTSLALNIATHVALKEKAPVAIFNFEMSASQLVKRIICSEAMIDLKKASEGTLSDDDFDKVREAVRKLSTAPIYINDTNGSVSVAAIRSMCRRLKMQNGLGMIVIDYLQLMNDERKTDNRQMEIAGITRSLKILARELEVPILVLSQLRREVEKQKKPMLSDLRESGAIEQDADTVIFIHRYRDEADTMDLADLIVAKQRSGPTDTIKVGWRGELTKFTCMDGRY